MLSLFTVFHLNLAYSSIEEEQRPQVVRDCYWPLLRLARKYHLPFGIEASAYTLESVAAIDPAWIAELRALTVEGPCEFVGSGYAQLIGPLVPSEVNAANLRLGNEVYRSLLGVPATVALVNEQAYSAGLLQHYIDAGYKAIVMEWDNPARRHPEWKAEWRYFPQIVCGQHGEELPLIWNKSIAFQKFQRYAHGELDLAEYVAYLSRHVGSESRAFPVYGNDIEVFDFRPGRYHTEPERQVESEWSRIEKLVAFLAADSRFRWIRPGQVLEFLTEPNAGRKIQLETVQDPVPVKKQEKYNINRWAVTGRNDLAINTACWRIYEKLHCDNAIYGAGKDVSKDRLWRELCYLWSSDFRTHIAERRWTGYRARLEEMERSVGARIPSLPTVSTKSSSLPAGFSVEQNARHLTVTAGSAVAVLNHRRGLAVDRLYWQAVSNQHLVGTLPHGYYDDIALGADFYSGHLVIETPAQPKVADLNPVKPQVSWNDESGRLDIVGEIETRLGPIRKTVSIDSRGTVWFLYELHWERIPVGSIRLGHVTLNPEAFTSGNLFAETENGGRPERFSISGGQVEHGRSVSFLVSSAAAFGVTGGEITVGDHQKRLILEINKQRAALVAQLTYIPAGNTYFCRVTLSAGELDDTTRERPAGDYPRVYEFSIRAEKDSA